MTIDKIQLNSSYLDPTAMNMFVDPTMSYSMQNLFSNCDFMPSSAQMFDFTQFMPGNYSGMDTFIPSYSTYPVNGAFNFNFEMPKFDMGTLMDLYNASIQSYKTQMDNFSKMLSNIGANWNTTPTESLQDVNYDANLAKKMAQNAANNAESSSQHECAKYVSDAIEDSGVSVTRGHAYQMIDNLRNNSHFKEISITKDELKNLPAGCVLVYPKGSAGYSSEYGHIEITLGNGKAASDFINDNPKYASNMKVFAPVMA